MSTRAMRFVRNSTEVGVFLAGIAVGLCGTMLSAAAVAYLQHGPYSAWDSGAAVTFWIFAFPLGLIGLIAGAMLGYGAAMQLWPPVNERRC
jgi:hypothetical protein